MLQNFESMIKYIEMEDFMKKKTNKLGYSIFSLALALSLPLNASATENLTKPENTTEPTNQVDQVEEANPTEDTNLITEEDIDTTTTETPAPVQIQNPAPVSSPVIRQTLPEDKNENYISQKGNEAENKERPFKVNVHDILNPESRLKKEQIGVTNHFTLNYGLGIVGDGLNKEYTISFFALKDSQIESLNLKNYIADGVVTTEGEKREKETKEIENDDYKGYVIKTKITNTGSVALHVKFDEKAEPGDYSLYYLVEMGGEKVLGKIDIKIERADKYDFFVSRDEVVRDYENYNEEKVNPFLNLPFSKYLLNDTEDDKNLSDYIDAKKSNEDDKILKISYIDPTSDEEKVEVIENTEEYKIPANSLAKLEVVDKAEGDDLIKSSDVKAEEVTDSTQKDEEVSHTGEHGEIKSLISLLNTQTNAINATIADVEADLKESKDNKEEQEKSSENPKAETKKEEINQKSSHTEDELKKAMAHIDRLLEEKKRSILFVNDNYDETEAEIIGLSMILREQTEKIETLIQQALLDNELDNLEELEKKNPDQANEEYKRLANLLKQAEDTTDRANEKLIELDEINQADLNTNPLIRAKKGEKVAVLNLGELTPITRIDDLTHDSPNESERDFSKNLEQKVARAVTKVETVTLTKDDDAKTKESPKTEDKKEDENKNVIVVDKDAKEADKKDDKDQKVNKNLSLPIFKRYLRRLKGRK